MAKRPLSEAEFSAAQNRLDDLVRATKRGTPERAAVQGLEAEWEAANALPDRTAQQRAERRLVIADTAARLGLLSDKLVLEVVG